MKRAFIDIAVQDLENRLRCKLGINITGIENRHELEQVRLHLRGGALPDYADVQENMPAASITPDELFADTFKEVDRADDSTAKLAESLSKIANGVFAEALRKREEAIYKAIDQTTETARANP